jgi:hypothetical protein
MDQRKNRQSHFSQRNGLTRSTVRIPLSKNPFRLDWWIRALSHCGQLIIRILLDAASANNCRTIFSCTGLSVCLLLNTENCLPQIAGPGSRSALRARGSGVCWSYLYGWCSISNRRRCLTELRCQWKDTSRRSPVSFYWAVSPSTPLCQIWPRTSQGVFKKECASRVRFTPGDARSAYFLFRVIQPR